MTKKSHPASDESVAQPPPFPNYASWAAKDTWTLDESILLLLNIDPNVDLSTLHVDIRQEYSDLVALAEKALAEKPLTEEALAKETLSEEELVKMALGKTLTFFHNKPLRFLPWVIFYWAKTLPGDYPPWDLTSALMDSWPSKFRTGVLLEERQRLRAKIVALEERVRVGGKGARPKYLDPGHPFYRPELAAAVRAWVAIQEDRRPGSPHPELADTEKYVAQHAKPYVFPPTVLKRIARIISVSKSGRPKKKNAPKS